MRGPCDKHEIYKTFIESISRYHSSVYGVASHKACHTRRPLLMYCASTFEFKSFLCHAPELSDCN
jgi:hypothetical protein